MTENDIGTDHCRVVTPDGHDGGFAWFEYYRHLFPYAECGRSIKPASRVLEVGFGSGYGAYWLSSMIPDITATDVSERAVAYALKKYPGVRFCQASGTALPFPEQSFDAVISFQVIEHIPDPSVYAYEIHRVLKPGGALYLTTPNRRLRLLPFQSPWNPYHLREYADRDLRMLLQDVFPVLQINGIMTTRKFMAAEIARVRKNAFLALLAPFYRTIASLYSTGRDQRPAAGDAGTGTLGTDVSCEAVAGLDDFFISQDTRHCLDLFVIAQRNSRSNSKK